MVVKKRLNINIKNSVLQGVLVNLVLMNSVTHCTFHKKFDALRLAGRTRFEYLYLAFSRKFSTKNHYPVTIRKNYQKKTIDRNNKK